MSKLFCYYDMAVSPCSYDFFTFLNAAEACRKRRKLLEIELILVQGPNCYFRQDDIRTRHQNETFFHNVIIPGMSILPSVKNHMWIPREMLAKQRIDQKYVFPKGYTCDNPVAGYNGRPLVDALIRGDNLAFFEAPAYAKENFEKLRTAHLMGSDFVTLTCREIERDDTNKTRQVFLDVWRKIVREAKKMGLAVIVIRDTSKAYDSPLIEGALEMPELSIHLPMRLAAYESALLNFTKNTGPATLQLFSRCRSIYFNEFDQNHTALSHQWYDANYGMVRGAQFPMTSTRKKMIWQAESTELVTHELNNIDKNDDDRFVNGFVNADNLFSSFQVSLRNLMENLQHQVLDEDKLLYRNLVSIGKELKLSTDIAELVRTTSEKLGIVDKWEELSFPD